MKSLTIGFCLVANVILLGMQSVLFGFPREDAISIGKREKIHSKILKEEKNLSIFLPDGYSRSRESYPILFMFYNGEPGFHYASGIVRFLTGNTRVPRMIVVAVDVDGRRDLTPTKSAAYGPTSGGADNFIKFLKEELVPYLAEKYRTEPYRIIWSHSIGGTLCIYALLSEPDLFQAVIVSSPWFIYDQDKRFLLKNTERFLGKRSGQKNFLFITAGNEPALLPSIQGFIKILEQNAPEGLTWKFSIQKEEDHRTIMLRCLPEGLRSLYGTNR